jgi:hypothetical protein
MITPLSRGFVGHFQGCVPEFSDHHPLFCPGFSGHEAWASALDWGLGRYFFNGIRLLRGQDEIYSDNITTQMLLAFQLKFGKENKYKNDCVDENTIPMPALVLNASKTEH